mmetsp:Transcript_41514/g.130818  ORF Transcript_41514/g.130818 Transcript_41514/m.130818 type:complete len:238 (+) Transcript_41514:58-771(+)
MVMYKLSKGLEVLHQHCHVVHGHRDGLSFPPIQHPSLAHEHVRFLLALWNLGLVWSLPSRKTHGARAVHAPEVVDRVVPHRSTLLSPSLEKPILILSIRVLLAIRRCLQEKLLRAYGWRLIPPHRAEGEASHPVRALDVREPPALVRLEVQSQTPSVQVSLSLHPRAPQNLLASSSSVSLAGPSRLISDVLMRRTMVSELPACLPSACCILIDKDLQSVCARPVRLFWCLSPDLVSF